MVKNLCSQIRNVCKHGSAVRKSEKAEAVCLHVCKTLVELESEME